MINFSKLSINRGEKITMAFCQNDESNTAIDCEIASSLRQHSKNSSSVITPSQFRSIFCKNNIIF